MRVNNNSKFFEQKKIDPKSGSKMKQKIMDFLRKIKGID